MPRHAPELECSDEDKLSLIAIAKSRTEEARAVERARIVLACVEGKEIQQVARELNIYPLRFQMASALFAVGAERTARPVAAGQAGPV
jgi:hypothetical protein